MKIFQAELIRAIDQYTIKNEPISSLDLMERAASGIAMWISDRFPSRAQDFVVFAGSGNNGGDGLAVARLLAEAGYPVQAFYVPLSPTPTADTAENLKRLVPSSNLTVASLDSAEMIGYLNPSSIVIDALFGSGLNRPVEGFAAQLIDYINESGCRVVSIDLPSGLMAEDNKDNDLNAIVQATYTVTLQLPKLSLLLPDNEAFAGEMAIVPIGLHAKALEGFPSNMFYTTNDDAAQMLYKRRRFAHKGTFGHCYLVAGSKPMLGAALLASKSCMHAGVGLLTIHIPDNTQLAFNISVPEVILETDPSTECFTAHSTLTNYDAIGIGPGLGQAEESIKALEVLLKDARRMPLVVDADALNILANDKQMLESVPKFAVLTPHPKEFERLAGSWSNDTEKLELLQTFAQQHCVYVVLKGANTAIASPDGKLWFASAGNPGMATAGSGDVLTGIILGLLGQGYSPEEASILGVHLHGMAGDIASRQASQESLIASDIISCIGQAFKALWSQRIL